MALLRDKNNQLVKRGSENVKVTTEGEIKERMKREQYEKEKQFIREQNQEARKKLNNEQQLFELDTRLGNGIGAVLERKRLNENRNQAPK